ncbi:MAG: hypothetical protein IKY82_02630 [Alistipes sp.]|nr:hypothetical protein [Alistipes sp.]
MNRTYLLNAVEGIATASGYTFYSDSEQRMPQQITAYPAVWLSPPQFTSMEGRKRGKVTYSLTLHAMNEGAKLSPAQRQQEWSQLEDFLVDLFAQLSEKERIAVVDKLKIKHSSSTLTTHGEVAATATAEVVTFF